MSKAHVLVLVDGRKAVVRRAALCARTVLAAVGADAARGDVLLREGSDGRLDEVALDIRVAIPVGAEARFRVVRAPTSLGRAFRFDARGNGGDRAPHVGDDDRQGPGAG